MNNIKKTWANGGTIVNGWLAIPSFFTTELMAAQGFDSLTIDLQHGLVDYSNLVSMLAAIKPQVVPMARVPWLEPGIIMKSLDAGCLGIICPMINNGEDAHRFMAAMRYPPLGGRSFGPIRAQQCHGANYAKHANDECLAIAMIETREALDNLDDIMNTPGLDAVYVGPADLANSLGHTPRLDPVEPEICEAIDNILAQAKEHNLYAGIHTGSASYAQRMFDKGFNLISLMSDVRLLIKSTQAELSHLRATEKPTSGAY